MKTKILFSAMLMLFLLNVAKAQSHKVGQANYNCKLNKKGWFFNSEKLPCPACEVTDKKEKTAKAVEDKRRNDVVVAKAKADKLAKEATYKKEQAERAEKNKVTEVAVSMPKTTNSKTSKSEINEIENYKIVNEFKTLRDMSEYSAYNSKILYKNKIIFESNDFLWIKAAWGKLLFIADYPRKDDSCVSSESNNSILLDRKGKKINLAGIEKFGYFTNDNDRDDYFVIVVYTGKCTPVKNDKYAKGDWHTIKYTFDYKTGNLIDTKPSWQHSNCPCN